MALIFFIPYFYFLFGRFPSGRALRCKSSLRCGLFASLANAVVSPEQKPFVKHHNRRQDECIRHNFQDIHAFFKIKNREQKVDHRIEVHQNPHRRRAHALERIQIQEQRNDRKQDHDEIHRHIKHRFGWHGTAVGREEGQNYNRRNRHLHGQNDEPVELIVLALGNQVKRKRNRDDEAVQQILRAFKA